MILYIGNPKDATRKLLELINEFGKVAGYKELLPQNIDKEVLKKEKEIGRAHV